MNRRAKLCQLRSSCPSIRSARGSCSARLVALVLLSACGRLEPADSAGDAAAHGDAPIPLYDDAGVAYCNGSEMAPPQGTVEAGTIICRDPKTGCARITIKECLYGDHEYWCEPPIPFTDPNGQRLYPNCEFNPSGLGDAGLDFCCR